MSRIQIGWERSPQPWVAPLLPSSARISSFTCKSAATSRGLFTEWDPFTAEPLAGLSCRLCLSGFQVPEAHCSAVWSQEPSHPEARACLQAPTPTPWVGWGTRRETLPRGGGHAGSTYTLLDPGVLGVGWGERFGGTCSRGTPNHLERAQDEKVPSPASVPLSAIFDRHPIFSLKFASISAGGSQSGLNWAEWQPGSRSPRTGAAGRSGSGIPASVFCFLGPSTRGRLSPFLDLGTPAFAARLSLILKISLLCSQTALPWGRLFPGMPPISRFHFRSQVCSENLFGTLKALGTPVSECPLRSRLPLGRLEQACVCG